MSTDAPILEVDDVAVHFPIRSGLLQRVSGAVRAVDGATLTVRPGESVGLVGESGCGKSTLARAIMQLVPVTSGQVRLHGRDLAGASRRQLQEARRDLQMVFQDPHASLNPRWTVGRSIAEPLRAQPRPRNVRQRVRELLGMVGMRPEHADRYPHEFSGGQRQRIGIARAVALTPKLVICDEPVSALDVSIQAQILNLLDDLRQELGLAYVFISHDLSVVRHVCERVAVMYRGRFVEHAATETLFREPRHPYTHSLLSAVPVADPREERRRTRIVLQGDSPSPSTALDGCVFAARCPAVQATCTALAPPFEELDGVRRVACHFPVADRSALLRPRCSRRTLDSEAGEGSPDITAEHLR